MKKKWIPIISITMLLPLCLSGCGEQIAEKAKEKAGDFLTEQGEKANQAIDDGLEAIDEYIKEQGAIGREHYFENQEEAEQYLLAGLKERYGKEFIIVASKSYTEYGPIYGDVYIAEVAPADNPEQVFWGRTLQAGAVTDTYGKIIFGDLLTSGPETVCESKPYILTFSTEVEGGYTERAWEPEDEVKEFLTESDGGIRVNLMFENGKSDEEYAKLILDFLDSMYSLKPEASLLLSIRDEDKRYLFFEKIDMREDSPHLTTEDVIESIEYMEENSPF